MTIRITFTAIVCGVLLATNSVWATPIVIDNGDAGYVGTGVTEQIQTGANNAPIDAYGADYAWNNPGGDHTDFATYTFSGLAAGTYNVFASWRLNGQSNTGGAEISMTDGGPTVVFNQLVGPAADLVINDGARDINFASVGEVTVTDGNLVVTSRLAPLVTNFFQADAIAIELDPVPEPSTMVLAAIGLLGLVGFARRRRRNRT